MPRPTTTSGGGRAQGTKDRDPPLEIKPVDPFRPEPVIVKLRFDDPKEVAGSYGPQFMYGIEVDGERRVLFASATLDGLIYDLGARKGDHVAILRHGSGTDTRWAVDLVDAAGQTIARAAQDRPREESGRTSPQEGAGDAGQPRRPPAPELSYAERLMAYLEHEHLYWASMTKANHYLEAALPGITRQVDLNASAYVLYRLALDHGIELDASGNPLSEPPKPEVPLTPEQGAARTAILTAVHEHDDGAGENETQVLATIATWLAQESVAWADLDKKDALAFHRMVSSAQSWTNVMSDAGELPF